MKITEQEVVEDIKKMFDTGRFEIPVTDMISIFNSGDKFPAYRVCMGGNIVDLECLLRFTNFYLEKKSKDKEDKEGEVVVTTNENGECVLVSRQDGDHNILKVIWEKKQ